jgi:hypothetical protein
MRKTRAGVALEGVGKFAATTISIGTWQDHVAGHGTMIA